MSDVDSTAVQVVADDLTFPTSLAAQPDGTLYVAEAGLPFGGAAPGGRVWCIDRSGERTLLADDLRPPVNGLTLAGHELYVSEGGHPARISRLGLDGGLSAVLEGLPGPGNYHTNMVAVGPDGKLYFSQGALTNLGVIGLDAYEVGWLRRLPHAHDIPGYDVTLAGWNATTPDPLAVDGTTEATTGAFVPFATPTLPGQRITAGLPATAAVMRCNADGSDLELVAWGLRNAYGLGFLPDGRLLAIDQGADDRGSRPVGNAPDLLFEVRRGAWYGWPDFIGGTPITDAAYTPQRGPAPRFLLTNHQELPAPEPPLLRFPPHTAPTRFAVAPAAGIYPGQLYIALFGDEAPMTGPAGPRVGRGVVRVDPADWSLHPVVSGPLLRPIDVVASGADELLVLDFGRFEMTEHGVDAEAGTGRVWRVAAEALAARTGQAATRESVEGGARS